ncbi:hypothetical protein GOB94_09160 [Granulicella sp. 5B5]|uniref:hypothetical protein n=1 Tax=Granulicella sp. 5B5 TaxID=1617967 RepID=UPI0015F6C418|nr:hypothetical protein [Granulicella sp. 5B5]QMV18833.1 hypothetical protein GOB94_09160 [Granulicella sp. 5B5]
MSGVSRGVTLVCLLLALMTGYGAMARAQSPLPTTTVQDTVYNASGAPVSGTVLVSWTDFTTASGAVIPAGTTSATIETNGALSIALAPNAGATPIGSYYTATFHLSDGTTSRQYWIVPVTVPGGGPAKLSAIQSQVLPTSVAMQTVSKAYVDHAIAAAVTGTPADTTSVYVLKTGDTMTGPLVLPADPVSPNQAADKNYVDENVTAIASGVGGKVSLLPSVTQAVSQPSGTELDVNKLNGELYASQYLSGAGNNGIGNALASADCASGCDVKVQPTYTGNDGANAAGMPSNAVVIDQRGGAEVRTTLNPLAPRAAENVSESVTQTSTLSAVQLQQARPGALGVAGYTATMTENALTGGSNQYPQGIETPPYFKNTYGVLQLTGVYNTQGQHVQFGNALSCYGVGDCLAGGQFITTSGGYRDNADEGAHPFDLQISEDLHVFTGTCTSGCMTGATSLYVTPSSGSQTQGDGRFLIDTNPAKTISSGQLTGGVFGTSNGYLPFGEATFTGTSFPVSVFLATSQAAVSQPANMAPGTVTLAINTSGVPAGYATSTTALPASGVACVADGGGGNSDTPNFEMANYTVVDGSHISLTLNKVHEAGATVAVGGLCGYGIEQTVDTRYGIRQLWPVVGSLSAKSLYYAESGMSLLGNHGAGSTSAYLNQSFPIASVTRASGVVTVNMGGSPIYDLTGLTLNVAGVADASYNGSFQVSMTGPNTFTYNSAGADGTSSGGTLSYVTGGYVLYPLAEVLSVFNPANKQVDGTLTLGANTVAWASGDTVEEPHYYKAQTYADTELITQYEPRPTQFVSAGKTYAGLMGVGARGWQITNATPANFYFGAGGSYNVPDDAYVVSGPWGNDFEVDAGASAVMRVHCNLYGCGRWDSSYQLFDLDAVSGGQDYLTYSPQSRTAAWDVGGISYSFSPQAFTAPTINVGTLNATTINGPVKASSLATNAVVNTAAFQHFHVTMCITTSGAGNWCDATATFPVAEPDTSYALVCMLNSSTGPATNAQASLSYYAPTTTTVNLRMSNVGPAPNSGVADCTLIHD